MRLENERKGLSSHIYSSINLNNMLATHFVLFKLFLIILPANFVSPSHFMRTIKQPGVIYKYQLMTYSKVGDKTVFGY